MMEDVRCPRVSVIVPTYNRGKLLARLVVQLGDQTLDPGDYEIVVVDDGSAEPARTVLEGLELRRPVRVEEQANAGPAAARHRGALTARGELLVFVDDDMQVPREFLREHVRAHPPGSRKAVLGTVRSPPDILEMPLFERWHQRVLQEFCEGLVRDGKKPLGNNMYTGNVSFRRDDYLLTGGFDPALGHSEDAELGLRLEKAGVAFDFSERAYSVNGSDRASLAKWRRRAELYGVYDCRIARKHPDVPHASPWRFWRDLNPVSRPVLVGTALAPPWASRAVAGLVYAASAASAGLGAERLALAGITLSYGIDYYRGVRLELGSPAAMVAELRSYLGRSSGGAPRAAGAAVRRFRDDARADLEMVRQYEKRYGHHSASSGRLVADAIQKIGLQIMLGIRSMRLLRDVAGPLAAKVVSRTLRHLYGCDIHWDAEFEPGVVVVHGMGLAISHAAHVSRGCILFQNVTLGMGIDPVTRQQGAPRLEQNVHVMPGATLIGPITVGRDSKVGPGAVVTESVPPRSVATSRAPEIRTR
jgi:serine acetyltransferase/glycosyltransferase involved in cell wall biosynthesis